jgi:hypothetical protein
VETALKEKERKKWQTSIGEGGKDNAMGGARRKYTYCSSDQKNKGSAMKNAGILSQNPSFRVQYSKCPMFAMILYILSSCTIASERFKGHTQKTSFSNNKML